MEERLSPIQHSRFCWYALSKTCLTFIFAVFSDGFPTEKRNNSRSLIGSSTKWRGRCSRSWTLGRSKSEGGAEGGLWKAPYYWEISQLVKNPYQCEKLLISNSLSLSRPASSIIAHHCPFFRPTDPVYRACSWLRAANQTLHHGNGKSSNYRWISYWNLETSIYGGFPSW